ncbi:MAG TPA: ABC transporter ATP-binding protein [Tepidisphaeraceae bacterium]|nr:ABC transporter ATP-binding protein [Tepidisphaeraceae bacterium]
MRFYIRAISYFKPDTGKIVLSLIVIAAMTLCGLLQVYPFAILSDSVFTGLPPKDWVYRAFLAISPSTKVGQIISLSLIVLGLRLVQELLQMVMTLLNIKIGYAGLMRVRCDLFRKLQELSLAYHKSQPQGDAIYRLSYDTYGFQTILNVLVQTIIVSSITLLLMIGIMLSKSWQLTLISLSVAPLLFWTTRIYSKILTRKATEAKEVDAKLTTAIQRSVATVGLVQAFGREADEYANFSTTVESSVAAYLRLHWQELIFWLFVGTIFGVGGAAIFGYGGYLVYRDQYILHLGEKGMTLGTLWVFLAYLTMLYGPLKSLSGSGAQLAGGVAGARRVFEVLDRDPIIKDAPDAIHLPKQPRTLALDHVVFEYRKDQPVLDDVSCTIKPGEMVAFVGPSGVGKTTLLNLLPRFYDPVGGAMRLDGHDARQIKIKDLRKHIALVLQESVILPTSVRENIAYGYPDATDTQVHHAAEIAGASVFIEKLPNGYAEQIDEAGQNLSGGQKQRISIARALLTEAPIIIMDEPTSALDPEHEARIVETLKRIKGQRTIILVSHRLSTVADCDQIFVMDAGKIIERGTHDELLALRGAYFRMAKHQMKIEDEPRFIEQSKLPA